MREQGRRGGGKKRLRFEGAKNVDNLGIVIRKNKPRREAGGMEQKEETVWESERRGKNKCESS